MTRSLESACISPLIIIPSYDFYHVSINDLRVVGVKDAGVGAPDVI